MDLIYIINYVILNWYKKKDKDPLMYAISVPAVLIFF